MHARGCGERDVGCGPQGAGCAMVPHSVGKRSWPLHLYLKAHLHPHPALTPHHTCSSLHTICRQQQCRCARAGDCSARCAQQVHQGLFAWDVWRESLALGCLNLASTPTLSSLLGLPHHYLACTPPTQPPPPPESLSPTAQYFCCSTLTRHTTPHHTPILQCLYSSASWPASSSSTGRSGRIGTHDMVFC